MKKQVSKSTISKATDEDSGSAQYTHAYVVNAQTKYHAALLENIQDAVISLDKDFSILSWNKGAENIYGWTEEEAYGKKIYELLLTDYGKYSTQEILESLEKNGSFRGEVTQITKDGRKLDIEKSESAIYNENGQFYAVVTVNKDITDRKLRERELIQQSLIINSVHDAIVTLDDKHIIQTWNKGAQYIYGYTAQEAIGKSPVELLKTEHPYHTTETFQQDLRKKGSFKGIVSHLTKDGRRILVMMSGTALFNSQQDYNGMVAILQDVTEARKKEELQAYQSLLLDNIMDAVISLDKDYNIQKWNKTATDIYGWTEEEAIGKKVYELLHTSSNSLSGKEIGESLRTNKHFSGEVTHITKSGTEISVWLSSSAILDEEGNLAGAVSIIRDITEAKKREANLSYHAAVMLSLKDAVYSIDNDFIIQSWNSGAEQIYGWTAEEAIGKKLYDLLQTDYSPLSQQEAVNQFYEKGYFKGEVMQTTKWGTTINVSLSANVLKDKEGKNTGAVTVNKDITDLKKKEAALESLTQNLQQKVAIQTKELVSVFERVTDGFCALNNNWEFSFINERGAAMFSRSIDEMKNKNIWELFPESIGAPFHISCFKAMESQEQITESAYYPVHDRWLEYNIYPSSNGVSIYFKDITDQKHSEEGLKKVSRLYHLMSAINQMIIRTRDENTIYKEACRIAISIGKFKMAWVGILDEDTKLLTPFIFDGFDHGYLAEIKISADKNNPNSKGPCGIALIEGKPNYCNDMENDPRMILWKEKAIERQYFSSIALPIFKFEKVIGVFTLYSDKKDFFNEEEVSFLEKVTSDISFSLELIEKETMRKKAEESVLKSERRYQSLTEISPVGIFHTNKEGYVTYVNSKWAEISGLTRSEALGTGWLKALHPDDKVIIMQRWIEATQNERSSSLEFRFIKPNGNISWVIAQNHPEKNNRNEVVGYVGTVTDITHRKQAEESILEANIQLNLSQKIAKIGYWEIDLTGKGHNYWSEEMYQLCERKNDGLVITPDAFYERIHPDEKEQVITRLNDIIENKIKSGSIEYRFISEDGSIRYMLSTGELILDENNIPLRINGTMQDITDRKLIELEIASTTSQLQSLTAHLQTIREEERKRIGRELHDELGQQLTAMKMDIAWISKKIPENEELIRKKMKDVLELLDGSNTSLRRILNELRPSILDQHGILDAIKWHSNQFTENTGIPVELFMPENEIRVSEQISTCIFRSFQEALTNITRYAEATKVVTSILIDGQSVILDISDNGKGFDTQAEQPKSRQPFGLLGMKERVRALNGDFKLESNIGKGTSIHITIPLQS